MKGQHWANFLYACLLISFVYNFVTLSVLFMLPFWWGLLGLILDTFLVRECKAIFSADKPSIGRGVSCRCKNLQTTCEQQSQWKLSAAPLGGQRGEGRVPTVDCNIFITARQILINSSCLFHWSMTIRANPSSLSVCCLPNSPHQSLILPLVHYQTVLKPPLEISRIKTIIGISPYISSSQLLQSNFCYHCVFFSAIKPISLFFPHWHIFVLTFCCSPFPSWYMEHPLARKVVYWVWNVV